jgi:hypothetical protein
VDHSLEETVVISARGKGLIAALAVTALVGCATPEKVAFNKEAANTIESVTIVLPPEPKKFTVSNLAHPGIMFGAIGGAIAAADQANKENKFSKAAAAEKFAFSAALGKAIGENLSAAGYKVKFHEGQWEEKNGKPVLAVETIPADFDIVLVITPSLVGYVSSGGDYQPTINAVVTLLARDRKTLLYRGYHSTGWHPAGDWRHTKATRTFRNFDALMAQPKESTDALALSAAAISLSIAEDLRRR